MFENSSTNFNRSARFLVPSAKASDWLFIFEQVSPCAMNRRELLKLSRVSFHIAQDRIPFRQQIRADLLVVDFHLSADRLEVGRRELDEQIVGRVKVGDVRPLVEIRERQPVSNGVSVEFIVRIGHAGQYAFDVRAVGLYAVQRLVPGTFDDDAVFIVPVREKLQRWEDERNIHTVLFEEAHDRYLIGNMDNGWMIG